METKKTERRDKIVKEHLKHTAFEYSKIQKRDLTILCNNIYEEAQAEVLKLEKEKD